LRKLPIFLAVLLLATQPAGAQALEDCPHYVPSTLEAWIASSDLRVAAYGYTCRMINIDAVLSRARREGIQSDDAATWADTYRRTLGRIREAGALNRRWAGPDASRNLAVLTRLEVKYRRLAEP
jgi:hypothetical protein